MSVVVQERAYHVEVRPPQRVEIGLTVQTARAGDRTVAVVSERRVETVALRGPTAVVREPAIRVVEIPRTVIGSAAVTVQDEGVPVGTRPTLNFQGAGVTASDDAANNRVNVVIPGGGGGGGGHTIKEDGTALPQRSGLNFVAGIVASDDAANDETDVNLDYGGTAELADVAATEAAGTSNKVPRADHVHAHGSGYLPDAHHAQVHAHDGADGSGTVSHASLTGVTADQHHARAHDHSQAADGNVVDPGSRLHAPRKTDPASPVVGEIWLNGALLKYRDNQATPATQTVQKRGDVITDAEHGSRGAGLHADSHAQSHAIDGADHTGTLDIGDAQFPAPPAGYPMDVAATEADGTSVRPARADHVHAHGSGYLPDAHHSQAHSDADHTGANKVAVQDEGTLVGTRATLNFTGAGVTATDDADNNRVNISITGGGGGGGQVYHAYVFTPRSEALVLQEDWQPVAAHRIPPTGEHGALTPLRFRVRAMNAGGGVNTVVLQTSATLTGARTTRATVALDAAQEAETTAFGTWTPADNEYLWVRATAVGTAPQNLTAELIVKEATF